MKLPVTPSMHAILLEMYFCSYCSKCWTPFWEVENTLLQPKDLETDTKLSCNSAQMTSYFSWWLGKEPFVPGGNEVFSICFALLFGVSSSKFKMRNIKEWMSFTRWLVCSRMLKQVELPFGCFTRISCQTISLLSLVNLLWIWGGGGGQFFRWTYLAYWFTWVEHYGMLAQDLSNWQLWAASPIATFIAFGV